MNMNFYLPTRVITGRDCIRRHAGKITACGTRAMLITSPSAARCSGALADVTGVLDRAGVPWQLYETIQQNPTLTACQEAAKLAADFGADFIIGIGGGSPLDAAKAVTVLTANPGMTQAELYSLVWPRPPLPVICVGTTAGTGSEVTAVAVLTRPDGVKKSICCDSLFPVLSISDPGYTALENRGSITSCDIHPNKTERIVIGARRMGMDIVKAQPFDAKTFAPAWEQAMDAVICDVPCSGLGVIRKKPDIRYKDLNQIARLPAVQLEILENQARYVKPGGVLLYSTCTILPRENEAVVDAFLSRHPDYRPEQLALPEPLTQQRCGLLTLTPHRHGTDGFFIAKLRRSL